VRGELCATEYDCMSHRPGSSVAALDRAAGLNGWPRLAENRKRSPEGLREELAAVETIAAALAQLPDQKSRTRAIRWAQEFVRANETARKAAAAEATEATETPAVAEPVAADGTVQESSAVLVDDQVSPGESSAATETFHELEQLFDKNLPPPELRPIAPRRKKRGVASILPRVIARTVRKRGLQIVFFIQLAVSKLV
jgi:hypothetical protein